MQEPAPPIPLKPPSGRRRPPANGNGASPDAGGTGGGPATTKPKVKKLRLALVVLGLSALAFISTIFGMMMAVAHELPALEAHAQLRAAVNSSLLGDNGDTIAKLTGNENRIIDSDEQISPNIKNAVIAIEDRRFYEHKGVDIQGIGRAVFADIAAGGHAQQGASTITEQFVKNSLAAQDDRTVFQKLREAALAYHLEHKWSKQKILNEYLNTVYFGNGAYGVESAVRTYFGGADRRYAPDERIANSVTPGQAAMLAAMIASPSGYDPLQFPTRARERRDQVLRNMYDQHMITPQEYQEGLQEAVPDRQHVAPPAVNSTQPYFSSWVTQQLVDRYGSGRVFGGGMKITSSLDPELQRAAEQAIIGRLGTWGPTASLVAIDNKTGAVKAMVGGTDFKNKPFNLATNGHRQPGSSIKPFILGAALEQGISPGSVWTSGPKSFRVPGSKHERFVVHNYENSYSGSTTLANALIRSDNSVFAEVGLKVGPRKVSRVAAQLGVKTKVSTNPAMVLGGLKEGVTPLEMAYAYSTIANRGKRVSGTFAASPMGPVAYTKVARGDKTEKNRVKTKRVMPEAVGETMRNLMHGVVVSGTGTKANVTEFAAGKTGTTENYGDAWFVGFTDRYTVAVWVGYPDKLKYMKTEYHGQPVSGGTYPAEIWHDFVTSAISIYDKRHPDEKNTQTTIVPPAPAPSAPAPTAPSTPQQPPTPEPNDGGDQGATPPQPQPQPAPAPQPAPGGGGGGGGGTGGGGGANDGGTGAAPGGGTG
jgi:penicillin-binding protein 1A